jgi:hypothetical protein
MSMMHRLDLDEAEFQIVRGLINTNDDEDLRETIDLSSIEPMDRAIALERLKRKLNSPQPTFRRLDE